MMYRVRLFIGMFALCLVAQAMAVSDARAGEKCDPHLFVVQGVLLPSGPHGYSFVLNRGAYSQVTIHLNVTAKGKKNLMLYRNAKLRAEVRVREECLFQCRGEITRIMGELPPDQELETFSWGLARERQGCAP